MTTLLAFVIFLIVIALIFDYINGFHDAANSIATVVSTRVLSPGVAVIWAAFFNFIAFAVFGTRVAKTIGSDLININLIGEDWRLWTLVCGVIGAVVWNLITWYYGLPSSSSHALVGGYAGAAIVAHRGTSGLLVPGGWIKTLSFILISPMVGVLLGFLLMVAILWLFRRRSPDRVDHIFRKLQLVSAALFSLGHGGNDAQKTMGIIAAALVASNINANAAHEVPLWVVLTCHAAIALGTLSGGW
jgi:PiT family inorganic phosphate transporter